MMGEAATAFFEKTYEEATDLLVEARDYIAIEEKADLFESSGAAAVDMESHAVAAVARKYSLPFLPVRAVADPATRSVPEFALTALSPGGRIRPGAVIARLLARPWEIRELLGLAVETRAAMASLRRDGELTPRRRLWRLDRCAALSWRAPARAWL